MLTRSSRVQPLTTDASIMPTVVSGNTNAASIMIGERAADLARQRVKLAA